MMIGDGVELEPARHLAAELGIRDRVEFLGRIPNAGEVLAGRQIQDVGREIFREILATASGKRTKSEQHGIGDEEFIPWTAGPTL